MRLAFASFTALLTMASLASDAAAAPSVDCHVSLSSAPASLDSAAREALLDQLVAALKPHFRPRRGLPAADAPKDRSAHLVAKVVARGQSCQLEVLLVAPPLLPRRGLGPVKACTAEALVPTVAAAVAKLLPRRGGEAEATSRPSPSPSKGRKAKAAPASRPGLASRRKKALNVPATPGATQRRSPRVVGPPPPSLQAPFRDRFVMGVGLMVAGRRREYDGRGAQDVGLGMNAMVEVYPFAGSRRDRLADLGLEIRYARLFQIDVMGALDWLEALVGFRIHSAPENGAAQLAGAVGWGLQAMHPQRSSIFLDDGSSPIYAHHLKAQLRGSLPFVRRRAWWFGVRAEVGLLWLLPAHDVAANTFGGTAQGGLVFSYRGVSGRLEALYRLIRFERDGAGGKELEERLIGGMASVTYAL